MAGDSTVDVEGINTRLTAANTLDRQIRTYDRATRSLEKRREDLSGYFLEQRVLLFVAAASFVAALCVGTLYSFRVIRGATVAYSFAACVAVAAITLLYKAVRTDALVNPR